MTPIPPLIVELRRSGRTLLVPPALTVLEALENEGVPINSMCRAGICGTCETVALTATELHSASPPRPATEPGSPSVPRRVSEPGSVSVSPRVFEPGSPNASRPVTGPPADGSPRPVRLCITAPGTLTHLVLDL